MNAAWAGLGYYRRARFLHEGAKAVVNLHGGQIPNTLEGLKSIPGIGEYTAGNFHVSKILSMLNCLAFLVKDQPVCAVMLRFLRRRNRFYCVQSAGGSG